VRGFDERMNVKHPVEHPIKNFFTQFIRISDVIKWTMISGIGFIIALPSLMLTPTLISLGVFLVTTPAIMSFTFGINNYYDVASDRENPRRRDTNIFVTGQLSPSRGLFFNSLFCLIALVVTFLFKPGVVLLCGSILFWMWIYSAPPLRIKSRPPFDVYWHFIGFVLIVLWGSSIAGTITFLPLLMALSLGVFSCIGQLWNHFVDYTFDRQSGIRTYAVNVGLSRTQKTLNYLIVLHLFFLSPLIYLSVTTILSLSMFLFFVPIVALFLMRPWKGGFPEKQSFQYYFTVVIGGTVYSACMLYRLLVLSGVVVIS
jgi:4-hydroxybenzoate polyprenyltransferase